MGEGAQPTVVQHSTGQPAASPLIKPRIDKLQYQVLQLPNRLTVLLISDPDADKAAAAMDVHVGSMSDPAELPGLAHFLEHMLFYSSAKYPEEDAYSKFIAEHGGHTNAYTAAENTNYHFDVNADSLPEALDRFAQFFIAPQISADGVEREVNAVDSEHGKNINQDPWRQLQLWRHTSNPAHPFHKFATGNLDTLLTKPRAAGIDPHARVREFYQRHYSASIMRAVVYGRQPLPELAALATEKLAPIPNKEGVAPPAIPPDVVTPDQAGRLIRAVPEQDGHVVEVQWAVPPEAAAHRSQPCHYVSHLLGHEGEGSVYAALKARGWATSLCAGEAGTSFSTRSTFFCRIDLTDEGHAHVREVLATVFAYLDILRAPGGVTKARFEEVRALAELRFNFADKQAPYAYAQSLAAALQLYPPRELLLGLFNVPQEYDEAAVRGVLADMSPTAARVMWASKTFQGKTAEAEPWYSTPFSNEPLPPDWLAAWQPPSAQALPGLHLPAPNPFIPSDFNLVQAPAAGEANRPRVVGEAPLWRLWHKANTSFGTPKAAVYLSFTCPEAYVTPEAAVLGRLLARLVADGLNELAYAAQLAGASYSLTNTAAGFLLTFYGYSHKLLVLVEAVLSHLATLTVKPDRFEVQKEATRKAYANMRYDQPYQTALYEASVVLEARRWHVAEYEAVLPDLTPDQLQAYLRRVMARTHVEMYATGNLAAEEALRMAHLVERMLQDQLGARPLFPSQREERRVVKLAPGRPARRALPATNPANDNAAIALTYQVGPDSTHVDALTELLAALAKRPAFHTLRTQEQLGYMTHLAAWSTHTVRALLVIIQSTVKGASVLEERVEAFLAAWARDLAAMPEAEFKAQAEELAKAKLEAPKRLRQAAALEWREIDEASHRWDRPATEAAALRALTKPQLAAFFEEVMLGLSTRRKLSVHVRAASGAAAEPPSASSQAADAAAVGEQPAAVDRAAADVEQPLQASSTTAPSTSAGEGGGREHEGGAAAASTVAQSTTSEESSKAAAADASDAGPAGAAAVAVEDITDIWAFKRRQELFPSPK